MQISVVTLFPELFAPFLTTSFVKRGIECGALQVHLEQLRHHGLGRHLSVDDTPYGGGSGMVLRVDCVVAAIEAAESRAGRSHRILMTPQGRPLTQRVLEELLSRPALTLICGRYEGFDERVRSFTDDEISLGDFVLTGGEVPAMALVEGLVRLLPGVLGNETSAQVESFSRACGGLLEFAQYTRPADYRGLTVPAVLMSGDHARIEAYRLEGSRRRTRERRPDLLCGPTEQLAEGGDRAPGARDQE